MTDPALWQPLLAELGRWSAAGRAAALWLRDDDAVEPSAPLDRLLDLTGRFQVPLVLAIIPAPTGPALVRRLKAERQVFPAVHGWAHRNHAPATEKKQELGPHRPRQVVLAELAAALARLQSLYGGRLLPLLVPPWNRIDAGLLSALPSIGFSALSAFGQAASMEGLQVVNTHVDLMDWRGVGRCRDHAELVIALARQLALSRQGDRRPVGLLTHHRAHDEAAWDVLEGLFEILSYRSDCRWAEPSELLKD